MTLKESLDRLDPDRRPNTCSVHLLFKTLEPEDAAALKEAIEMVRTTRDQPGNRFTSSWIAEALKSEGHLLGATSIRRHVRRECRCAE